MQVVMGGLSLDMEEPTEQTINVEEAIVHENYRDTSAAVYNDIGDPCAPCIIYKLSTHNIIIQFLNQYISSLPHLILDCAVTFIQTALSLVETEWHQWSLCQRDPICEDSLSA